MTIPMITNQSQGLHLKKLSQGGVSSSTLKLALGVGRNVGGTVGAVVGAVGAVVGVPGTGVGCGVVGASVGGGVGCGIHLKSTRCVVLSAHFVGQALWPAISTGAAIVSLGSVQGKGHSQWSVNPRTLLLKFL